MSTERARKLGVPKPVPILGFGYGQTSWDVTQRPDMTSTQAKVAGETAFKMAGLKPKDMDVAQIYDCFTITGLMTLEDYGFAKKAAGRRLREGRQHRDRRRAADEHLGRHCCRKPACPACS